MPTHTKKERSKKKVKVVQRKKPVSIFTAMQNVAKTAVANSRKKK